MAEFPANAQVDEELIQLSKRVDAMVDASTADNEEWLDMYRDAVRYIYGDQLHGMTIKAGWEKIQCNYLLPAMSQTLALISQQQTKILANPAEDSDIPGARFAQDFLQYQYEKSLRVQLNRLHWIMDGFANGCYATYCYWEPKPDGGWNEEKREYEGRIVLRTLAPGQFGADPTAEAATMDAAEYVYVKRPVSVDWAMERWSENAEEIESAATAEQERERDGGSLTTGIKISGSQDVTVRDSSSYNVGHKDTGPDPAQGRLAKLLLKSREDKFYRKDGSKKPAKVTMVEIWFHDREMENAGGEEIPIENDELFQQGRIKLDEERRWVFTDTEPNAGEFLTEENRPTETTPKYERPKYPYGRYVQRIGNVILNPDDEDQRWEYPEGWPVRVQQFKLLPHTWHGMNAVEIAKELQDWLNIFVVHMLNWVKYFGDPVWIVEEDAIAAKKGKISNAIQAVAGAILKMRPGKVGAAKREQPPPMQQGLMQLFGLFDSQLRNQTGIHEIVQGIQSKGSMTASEALRLETNSRIHIALILWLMDMHTTDLMRWVFALSKKHYSAGDMVRIVGEDQAEHGYEVVEGDFDADFDLKLEVGTSLPFDEERKKEEALTLLQTIGPAFTEKVLDAFNIANKDEILQKIPVFTLAQQIIEEQNEAAEEGQAAPAQAVGEAPPAEGGFTDVEGEMQAEGLGPPNMTEPEGEV